MLKCILELFKFKSNILMASRLVLLFSLLLIVMSCSKEDSNPNPETEFLSGEVVFIAKGTSFETGFCIELKTPIEEMYFATISDTALAQEFTLGKDILLKGILTDNYLEVFKIISTDNDIFNLQGEVTSIDSNKDGYSAGIRGIDEEVYNVIFSIPNMEEQYHVFKIGDTVNITGELWLLNKQLQVTARSIN